MLMTLWIWVAIIPAAVWAVGWYLVERGIRSVSKLAPAAADTAQPRVAVIVPAYNEQALIERNVRSIMAQAGVNFELIVVDDRSTDDTPRILARLASEFAGRMRVVTNRTQREGWGNKTHALHVGATAAGDAVWLCFIDADHWLTATDLVARALAHAQREGLDYLTLYPQAHMTSLREKLMEPGCMMTFVAWYSPMATNNPKSPTAMGNAAFMLVKRATYDRVGGHEPIRTLKADDIALAQLIKSKGGRVQIVDGSDAVAVRMYPNLRHAWHGWKRIHAHAFTVGQMLLSIVSAAFNTLFLWASAIIAIIAWGMDDFAWQSPWRAAALAWGGVLLLAHVMLWRYYKAVAVKRLWLPAWPVTMVVNIALICAALIERVGITATGWRGDLDDAARCR